MAGMTVWRKNELQLVSHLPKILLIRLAIRLFNHLFHKNSKLEIALVPAIPSESYNHQEEPINQWYSVARLVLTKIKK
ncbi:MAG: hypothetical protein A2Z38_02030 [Planctomycetes bacterium RBG_19FT_COMBO_48_8]|nr:MAG: hypothetical protein A2Z38_02030 [Planctomycetes bacterium RBG_19FT_COMBO_48_8]